MLDSKIDQVFIEEIKSITLGLRDLNSDKDTLSISSLFSNLKYISKEINDEFLRYWMYYEINGYKNLTLEQLSDKEIKWISRILKPRCIN